MDKDITCTACKKSFLMRSIVQHIEKSKCRTTYSDEEISRIKKLSKQISAAKKKEKDGKRHEKNYDPRLRAEQHKKEYDPKKRAEQRNAWLIQHCYSPYGTTQLEKTGKKGSFGPRKAPFGAPEVLGGPRGGKFVPNCPRLGWIHGPQTL